MKVKPESSALTDKNYMISEEELLAMLFAFLWHVHWTPDLLTVLSSLYVHVCVIKINAMPELKY